ncbi:hypothetical protein L211DRAFT_54462 [Terfezia boudieri ATCC MYA-4762]|uniref:Uncharacterized protein n=1 Tax=Terfezia boudieri ATCC MYA-4762 TaxID=1051890 RepID=A0A3N4LSE7_9PEZI|nr:hypothetical protein L211DRAFT_54462 [Terfezia boudieri ATCC MYA-4762]
MYNFVEKSLRQRSCEKNMATFSYVRITAFDLFFGHGNSMHYGRFYILLILGLLIYSYTDLFHFPREEKWQKELLLVQFFFVAHVTHLSLVGNQMCLSLILGKAIIPHITLLSSYWLLHSYLLLSFIFRLASAGTHLREFVIYVYSSSLLCFSALLYIFSLILLSGVIWLVKAFKYCHLVCLKLNTYFNLLIFALYSGE